jgi:hypothetical protein
LIKILAPLGKTLAIVPLERNNNINRWLEVKWELNSQNK